MRFFHADKAVPPAPMPQDKGGWRVAPAPDGRGMPRGTQAAPAAPAGAGFWIFVLVLLAINWLSVLLAQPSGQPRVKVPFTPFFLSEVQAGQVKSISSKADTISGTFTTKVRYPPGDAKATPTTLFSTQVPAFWNNHALTALLRSHKRRGQRPEPEPGDLGAGRDPARVRADAAARRPVRAARAPRSGRRRRPRRAGQFRPLAGAAGGPGEDPGDVR